MASKNSGNARSVNNDRLAKSLALHKKKVVLSRGMPEKYISPPWRVPSGCHPRAGLVNDMLNHSRKIQGGVIPNHDDFKFFIVSNAQMAVSCLLRTYFRAVLGKDFAAQSTQLIQGVFLWDLKNPGANEFQGMPYVWLEIFGHAIDNAYVDYASEGIKMGEDFPFSLHKPEAYIKEDIRKTQLRLYYGQEEGTTHRFSHNHRVFLAYGDTDNNVEKLMSYMFRFSCLNLGLKIYDSLMRDFLRAEYGAFPEDLEEKWERRCWNCEKETNELKTCQKCKKAKYCGKECQQAEWKSHKMLHKVDGLIMEEKFLAKGHL